MNKPLGLAFAFVLLSANAQPIDPPVKKSMDGICHHRNSKSFHQIERYVPYETIGQCVAGGGKLQKQKKDAPPIAAIKKSESGGCFSQEHVDYESIKIFQPYRSMSDCLKGGGQLVKH